MEFRVEIGPLAVFVLHPLWLGRPVNSDRGVVPAQPALRLRGVKGADVEHSAHVFVRPKRISGTLSLGMNYGLSLNDFYVCKGEKF